MKKSIFIISLILFLISPINIKANQEINVTSDYVYLYDMDSKQILLDKDSDKRIYPASMTKMMSLIIALDNLDDLQQRVVITDEMLYNLSESNATVAGFSVNENPKIIDLMYGIMLPSGADCTNALAYHISGNINEYVKLMNDKAKQLNMNNTHFTNTTGLHDNNHYTTLKDLSLLLDYCYKNETFKKIFSTDKYISSETNKNPNGITMNSTVFKNINNSNSKYNTKIEGFIGGKTGYTNKARYCLASVVEHDGIRYGLITAHAWIEKEIPSNAIDAGIIYNYFFQNYHKEKIYNIEDVVTNIPVYYSFKYKDVNAIIKDDVYFILKNNSEYKIEIDAPKKLYADINSNNPIGRISILYDDKIIYEGNIYPEKDIKKDYLLFIFTNIYWFILKYKIIIFTIIFVLLFLLFLLLYIRFINIRKRRKRRYRKI